MERKWQLIIFFIAMIILSAGGYGYIISESTAPPEMETYDFGEFTMEIPEDSNVKLAGSDLSLSVYVGDNFQVIKINKTFYENQNELNHILECISKYIVFLIYYPFFPPINYRHHLLHNTLMMN